MKKALITLLIPVLLGLLLQIDDDLSPESEAWLAEEKNNQHSQAYLLFLGMIAAEDDDPIKIGQTIYNSIQQYETTFLAGEKTTEIYQYPEDKQLPLSESDIYCNLTEQDCYQSIIDNEQFISAELDQNQVLLERYQKFLAFNDFHIMAKPLLETPIPPYQYLSRANRLFLLQHYSSSEKPESINKLIEYAGLLKQHITLSNTLISKMVFRKMLSDTIDVLWFIKSDSKSFPELRIEPLSTVEKNMLSVFQNEFELSYLLYQHLDKHPEFVEERGDLPTWSVRLLFKPNMTSNDAFRNFYANYDISQLTADKFAEVIDTHTSNDSPLLSVVSIRNPVGKILFNVAKPELHGYIQRMHSLNAKIELFNQINKTDDNVLQFEQVQNPYYPNATAYLTKDQNWICFKTPLEDTQHEACLMVH